MGACRMWSGMPNDSHSLSASAPLSADSTAYAACSRSRRLALSAALMSCAPRKKAASFSSRLMPYTDASRPSTGRSVGSALATSCAKFSMQKRSLDAQPSATATSSCASNTAAAAFSAASLPPAARAAANISAASPCASAASRYLSRATSASSGSGPAGSRLMRTEGAVGGAAVSALSSTHARATCCIMTVLSPSNVTSTFMSFAMGPILLTDRKPMPPQHSRQSCSVLTRDHVAAALSPELSTWMALASEGRPASTISLSLLCASCSAYVLASAGSRRRWCVRYSITALSPNCGRWHA
mmetsp:Transcript_16598/g.41455  ORF Transcript_16598/g.41455 Transcript_16598/m.41455 type:complete len:299 (+) Transcript_16598:719-1615(+)